MDDKILRTLKNMAWERAKGELRSMLHTCYGWGEMDTYENLQLEIDKFVKKVEDEGYND